MQLEETRVEIYFRQGSIIIMNYEADLPSIDLDLPCVINRYIAENKHSVVSGTDL